MVVMNVHDNRTKAQPRLVEIAMQSKIFKLCADSLRTFSKEKHNIKLKAAHAHELVAAFFGYSSKNAMLADSKYSIRSLNSAEIIVMTSDEFIDQRRDNLQGLSSELPNNYTLGEVIYGFLFSDEYWSSPYPPFRSFEKLAKFLVENNDAFQNVFKFYRDIPMHHIVDVKDSESELTLTVLHSYRSSTGEMLVGGKTTIKLPRVVGRIGYGKPKIDVEQWTSGARRTLKSMGVQL